jgi:PAS domain S-box-containing protein
VDLLRRQVDDLARELAERDRVLHERTRHLQVAQALAHLGSWNWDIASGEVEWSDELYQIFGYEPRSRAMTFDSFVSAVLPDDHDRVLASIDDALAGAATYDLECRIVRPDGEVRMIHCCGEVVRDCSGQPLRMSGTALDITDRKRAEEALAILNTTLERQVNERTEALRASEERLRLAMEAADLGSWDVNVQTGEAIWNRRHAHMQGYAPDPGIVSIQRWKDRIHPDDLDRVMVEVERAKEEHGLFSVEHRTVWNDGGEERWLSLYGRFFYDEAGVPVRFSGVSIDITEGKRTAEALRKAHDELERKVLERTTELQTSEERYGRATAIGKVGVWEMDIENSRYYYGDAHLKAIFGYAPEELSPEPYAWLNLVHPDDRPIAMKNWELVHSGAADECHCELRMVKKDGSIAWTDVRCHGIRDHNGRLTRLIGAMVDISERKQAEETLWKSRQAIRALHDISSAQGQSFKERVEALLQLGCRFFDLPIGMETLVRGDELEVGQVVAPGTAFHSGMSVPLGETYCGETIRQRGTLSFEHAGASPEWQRHPAYAALKLESYIGTEIKGLDQTYGTLCFASVEPRAKRFTESERDFVQLMARWLGGELDRQSALDALRQSEERYRTLYDETPSMYFTVDRTGIVRSVNQYGAQCLGYRVEDLVGKSVSAIFFEADRARVSEEIEACFHQPERVAQWELRKVRSDGMVLWVREHVRVLQSRDGEPIALIVCEDITERKRTEDALASLNVTLEQQVNDRTEALRRSEERFRQFFDNAPNATCLKDRSGRHLYTNRRFEKVFGLSTGMAVGKTDGELFSLEQAAQFQSHDDQVLTSGLVQEFEEVTQQEDGPHTSIVVKFPVTDASGELYAIGSIATDITERKRILEQLRLYQEILTHSINGIAIIDTQGRYLQQNRAHEQILGYSTEDLAGKTPAIHLGEESFARIGQTLATVGSYRGEVESRRKGGTVLALELTAFAVKDAEGQPVCYVSIVRDVTERNRAQEALRESEARWQQFAESVGSAFWIADVTPDRKKVMYVNSAFTFIWGIEREEIYRNWSLWLDSIHPDDRMRVKASHDRFLSGGATAVFHCEYRIVGRDGHIRWISDRRVRMAGWEHRIAGIAEDITHHKQQLALMAQTESIGKIGGWQFDFLTDRLWWSDETYRLHETTPELFSPTMEAALNCYAPESRPIMAEAWRKGVAQGQSWDLELELISLKGRRIAVRATGQVDVLEGQAVRAYGTFQDITERKRAAEALQQAHDELERKVIERTAELQASEERFVKAFQASPHPVVISELDSGRVVDANDVAYRMFGYRKEEVLGQTTLQIGIWHSMEERDQYRDVLKRQGSVRDVEVNLRSSSGEVRRCLLSSELIELNGKPCVVTVGNDVTESKRMEQALRLTQFSVDHAVEAILWLDPNARIFNVNDTACRMLEYPRQDLMTMTVHDIDPNFPVEQWANHWEYLKQRGSLTFEARFWPRTGTVLETDVSVNYLQYEGKEYGCMILRDIGERKRAEAELHRSHAFLRQVIDTDPNFIFAKDRDGRYAMANKAVADCYGTTVEDLIGKSDTDFNGNAEEVEFFRQNDLEVMDSAKDRFIPEERLTDAGGRTRWLQTVKRPIFDDQGRVQMVLGAATDITERKRMEEVLLQRERDLSAALEERERISQDLHDGILQSLYAIGLGLESCKPLIRKQQGQVAEKFMATLDQAIGQLNQVMTEVRNFIAGLESHVMQGGDFSTALRTMVETMSISSPARCRVRIDDAAAQRLSTEQALHIINIVREGVSNALRHSRAKQITVSLRDLLRSDRLAVTDDGIGFNMRSVQGVGHGLVNMAARAQKVRGSFAVQSKPDKGTKISLDLPKDTHYAHS